MISDRFAYLRARGAINPPPDAPPAEEVIRAIRDGVEPAAWPPPDPGVAVLTALLVLDERDRARSTACLLEEELARLAAENARLREALADPFPTSAYQRWLRGGDDEAADQIDAWRERRRAALASPVREESDG